MNWFEQARHDWIEEMLEVYGYINREHLMKKFGIKVAQASHDLVKFSKLNPGSISYDSTRKAYIRYNNR